jgi:hypothetical protein
LIKKNYSSNIAKHGFPSVAIYIMCHITCTLMQRFVHSTGKNIRDEKNSSSDVNAF